MTTEYQTSTKQTVLNVLDCLPDDASIDDVVRRLRFVQELHRRLERIDLELTYTPEQIEREHAEWQD